MRAVLMTWNIHRCIGVDRRFDPERVLEVIRHHDPDVLFLQEVDRGVPRSRRLWLDHLLAKELDYPYHTWAQGHVLKEGSYGNATLSRGPSAKLRVLDLRIGSGKARNALYTRLRPPHGAHLPSRGGRGPGWAGEVYLGYCGGGRARLRSGAGPLRLT